MKNRFPLLLPLLIGGFLALVLLLLLPRDWMGDWGRGGTQRRQILPGANPRPPQLAEEEPDSAPEMMGIDPRWTEASEKIMESLRRRLEGKDARDKEALLTFKSEEAYRKFLERAAAAGLKVVGKMDAFQAVRVAYDSLDDLHKDILENAGDYGDVSANYYAYMPDTPAKEERAAQSEVAFGDEMLPFLGVFGDHSSWGKGVTVAVLDSGVTAYAGLDPGQVRYIDIGQGLSGSGSEDGHGTAVGYLVDQVAPGAEILSIRVTGADGVSDLFTLAQGIQTAVDSGASVINISLGAYQNSLVLSAAIAYAAERGVAVVAAAGNDQAAQLTWPAADNRVVSVGAVDALGQQATFSNSGEDLSMTAPGYGINTPWLNGARVAFDGTSASSPIVAGAIAAILSQYPQMTTTQAAAFLQNHSNDEGAPGADASYGAGILNLGWAMNSSNPQYLDTAVASQHFNNKTGQVEITLQNRSGLGVSGLQLQLTSGASQNLFNVPAMMAGSSYTVAFAVDQTALNSAGGVTVRSRLINPSGVSDALPANNQRGSVISKK
ncbi:MAG: S8 family serine peptidase [Verrucomicrobiota bacterium]